MNGGIARVINVKSREKFYPLSGTPLKKDKSLRKINSPGLKPGAIDINDRLEII
jgi:hypothetical protein